MADDFDPYFKWLGIPPGEQPPNHYRLLGIPLFVDDPDVISNAADQRMVHLRQFQGGQRADVSQKILNEVSAARGTLSEPQRKLTYDDALKQQMGFKGSKAPLARPEGAPSRMAVVIPAGVPIGRPVMPTDAMPPDFAREPEAAVATRLPGDESEEQPGAALAALDTLQARRAVPRAGSRKRQEFWLNPLALGAMLLVLAGAGLVIYLLMGEPNHGTTLVRANGNSTTASITPGVPAVTSGTHAAAPGTGGAGASTTGTTASHGSALPPAVEAGTVATPTEVRSLDVASIAGSYQLSTRRKKNLKEPSELDPRHKLFLGRLGKVRVIRELDGTFYTGTWSLVGSQVDITFDAKTRGRAVLQATREGGTIILTGSRIAEAGEWKWIATRNNADVSAE